MRPSWATYRHTIGDRSGLFAALAEAWAPTRALYPECYLDLAPPTAIPSVVYVDTDRRAGGYFADAERVAADLTGRTRTDGEPEVTFQHADYTDPLGLPDSDVDLLMSLFAGRVWDHCERYLAPRGLLQANASHGDASLAALDPRLELVAAAHQRGDEYHLDREALASYLRPNDPRAADPDLIRREGRGIAYTRTAFAYLFRRT